MWLDSFLRGPNSANKPDLSLPFILLSLPFIQKIKGSFSDKEPSLSLKLPSIFFWTTGDGKYLKKQRIEQAVLHNLADLSCKSLCPCWMGSYEYIVFVTVIQGCINLWFGIQSNETPPPGKVFYLLCSLFKNQEEEDPPRNTWYKFFGGGPLPPGSWLGNIMNRKPPRGGGAVFLSINLHSEVKDS